MPPKRSATKAEGLLRKKAKTGAILSGISRSAPGNVAISSMVDLPNSTSAQLKLSNILVDDKSSGNTNTASLPHPVATITPIPPSTKVITSTFCLWILLANKNVSIVVLLYVNNLFHAAAAASISTLWKLETKISSVPCAQGEEMGGQALVAKEGEDGHLAKSVILEAENHFRSFKENAATSQSTWSSRSYMPTKALTGVPSGYKVTKPNLEPQCFVAMGQLPKSQPWMEMAGQLLLLNSEDYPTWGRNISNEHGMFPFFKFLHQKIQNNKDAWLFGQRTLGQDESVGIDIPIGTKVVTSFCHNSGFIMITGPPDFPAGSIFHTLLGIGLCMSDSRQIFGSSLLCKSDVALSLSSVFSSSGKNDQSASPTVPLSSRSIALDRKELQ
ncbi:hypothetical protein F4604DRAFT_1678554 [Suillus subluteus]|nr:hypothetical protein F4604DRAFT_1678554 [Suillus subluteus]